MASYPNTIKTFTDPTAASNLNFPSHAQQHIDENAEITAIQTELGLVPKGSSATVKARLDAIDTTTVALAAADAVLTAADLTKVDLTTAQTVAGVKTFSSSPVVPATPTTSTQAASKSYVDTKTAYGSIVQAMTSGTNYLAATDGYVLGYITIPTGASGNAIGYIGYSDASAAPTTIITRFCLGADNHTYSQYYSIFFSVKKSNYYRVVLVSTVAGDGVLTSCNFYSVGS